MYETLVGGYDQLVGADPDVRALIGSQYMMGAAQPNQLLQALHRGFGMHPGAAPAGMQYPGAANLQQQLMAQQAQQNAINAAAQQLGDPVVMQPQGCLQARYLPAGFESLAILTTASAVVTVRPQCLFRADRLVIPYAGNGEFFSITAFNIGQTNLLVGAGPVPAGTFAENATGMIRGLGLPTNQPVQEITLVFKNISGATHDIRGCFEGRAVF
jgi:hypothetical protein